MMKFINKLKRNESGAAELINAMIFMPVMIILIFSIFNVGSYFIAMSQVGDVAQQMARKVAMYGGENSNLVASNNAAEKVSTTLKKAIWSNGKCVFSSCKKEPVVTCTGYLGVIPGTTVNCRVTYYFKSNLSGVDFGLSSLLEKDEGTVIAQYSTAETWGWPASVSLR